MYSRFLYEFGSQGGGWNSGLLRMRGPDLFRGAEFNGVKGSDRFRFRMAHCFLWQRVDWVYFGIFFFFV